MNWLNSVLHKYIQFQKNRIREENLSGATFANYFKAIKKFCYANELDIFGLGCLFQGFVL